MHDVLEIKLLKETIQAIREELERVQHEEREHIQQAVAEASAEIRHLRSGIVELRDQMELQEAEHEQKVQNLRLQHQHAIAELHQTITALRQKLEEADESSQRTSGPAKNAAAAGPPH